MPEIDVRQTLLDGLTKDQERAVTSSRRRVLVVAGAGSGKTEVMARRIGWWIGIDQVAKDKIVAFTFTDRAAEEMKFRIRSWIQKITPAGEDVSLGGMYVGTIHGFCLAKIREFWPDDFHNYDVLDDAGRTALVLRGYNNLLGLRALQAALSTPARKVGQYATLGAFTQAYDQLHEHDHFEVKTPSENPPFHLGEAEQEWCKEAELQTDVGATPEAKAFAVAAARYYAYLRCRRFLDFSTSQTELIRQLRTDNATADRISAQGIHLVVDEVQDINPVQRVLMESLVGKNGRLTAVGDHRQSIYAFRGAKVEIIAQMWEEFVAAADAEVVDLQENFRSTPRIIDLANRWAATISPLRTMKTPAMKHGNNQRKDYHSSHVALVNFHDRDSEANWIAEAIKLLVPTENEGAQHDKRDGAFRGLVFSDIAILVRTSTDVRTYMQALEAAGIPSVVRAGPDLFSQPEVLFFIAALAISAGHQMFYGSEFSSKSLPNRIQDVLGCAPEPEQVLKESAKALRLSGLPVDRAAEERVLLAARAMHARISKSSSLDPNSGSKLRTPQLRKFLTSTRSLRRVFPQQLFHFLLAEAQVEGWDTGSGRGQTAMFHLGALSTLITGIETPGWTSTQDYPWQVIGLCQYGSEEGRVEEQPLLVRPDAVTVSTIHGAKGLEFAAIFLADVVAQRFPNSRARRKAVLPLSGTIIREIDVDGLSDNDNHDGERRLMYVALTRAERFLFVSYSGSRTSSFIKEMGPLVDVTGGIVTGDSNQILQGLKYLPKEYRRDLQFSTSFSDLRYFLECSHDFYLRKVLGFSPTIDQAFGYGRGVHNLLRAIHSNPRKWSAIAGEPTRLEEEIAKLIDRGLFYLRYTTGDPAENMRRKGIHVVADYIRRYAAELATLQFEPEKPFETLVDYEDTEGGALISGSIDVVRQDDPPRVTLIDFKTSNPEHDERRALDEEEMKLQVAIYAVAAKKELEFQPELGLVRYLGSEPAEHDQLNVPLNAEVINAAKSLVARTAGRIRDRSFNQGPVKNKGGQLRCASCDFTGICGMKQAVEYKKSNPQAW